MTSAIDRQAHKKKLPQDRLGDSVIVGFDEAKRMIALCVTSDVSGSCQLR
jgi:hypothetical protein